jgi:hypothetical protein
MLGREAMRAALITLTALALLVPGLAAGDYYSYTTDEGTLAFTDEAKRIPARYRNAAERHADRGLVEYSRSSFVARGVGAVQATTPDEDRAATREADAAPAPGGIALEAAPGVWVPAGSGDAPVVVESAYAWRDGIYRPQTIVRRGDEVIAVIGRR